MTTALHGPAGRLEAIYRPLPGARKAAVLCHSHPRQGGSMYDGLLHRIACALHAVGISTLRFNLRGAGRSDGRFDDGLGELDDVRAALDHAARDHVELAVVGHSFGAWVGLRAALPDPRVTRLVGLGLPTRALDFDALRATTRPLLIIHGECDEYGSLAHIRDLLTTHPEARLELIPGDHFFTDHQSHAAQLTATFLTAPPRSSPPLP